MKKTAPRVITRKKKNWNQVWSIVLSLVLVGLGILSLLVIQSPLQQSQELRRQASVDQGLVSISTQPTSGSILDLGQPQTITFNIDTAQIQVHQIQLVLSIVTDTFADNPIFSIIDQNNLEITNQEVEKTADGFLVSATTQPVTGSTFATNSDTPFAQLTFMPVATGSMTVEFDRENSVAMILGDDQTLVDGLTHIPSFTFEVTDQASASASPSPSPSVSPSPSPSVSPSPSPEAVGGVELQSCGESCDAHADCENNLMCYQGECRYATNPSSETCSAPPDYGFSKSCNEKCADTTECSDGLTCWYNQCRNPQNLESTICAAPTIEQTAALSQSCNQSCTSHADCAVNLMCYQGECRLVTNPSSSSCTAATTKTVSNLYADHQASKGAQLGPDKIATITGVVTSQPIDDTGYEAGNNNPADETALDFVQNYLRQRPWIAQFLIGAGLALLLVMSILAVMRMITRRRQPNRNRPNTPPASPLTQTPEVKKVESDLEKQIAALKQQPPHSSLPPMPPASPVVPPTQPTPITPGISPTPVIPPVQPVTPTVPTPTHSSMLDRMKSKNIPLPGQNEQQVNN